MEKIEKKKKIYVGLSGGVDSSVAAYLLKNQKENIIGAFIRTWQPDFIECTWREERRDAIRVAAHLGIPFIDVDAEDVYKDKVAQYMIDEYKKGRTPNPDILCNREIKFGVLWEEIQKYGGTHIATGHYAQNIETKYGYELHMAKDQDKDQTYFLWKLTQEDLSHVFFPVGHLVKSEVRVLAGKSSLSTAEKKDSQGVCMLGDLDMKDFLKHYIQEVPGKVLDIHGNQIGNHNGVWFFTLGERHGFHIDGEYGDKGPWYVVDKDIEQNILIVHSSQNENPFSTDLLRLENINIVSWNRPKLGEKLHIRTRYREPLIEAIIDQIDHKSCVLKLSSPHSTASKGQSVVMYRKTECVGGGIIL